MKELAQSDMALLADPNDPDALIARARIMLHFDNPLELCEMGKRLARCQHPDAPYWHDHILTRFYNHAVKPAFINIGGGPDFHYPGWRNFDSAESALNPIPERFTPDVSFPVKTGSANVVYSSHCLEHLDDAAVDRVLTESRRMLRDGGMLVLKLPDFEEVLVRWRAGDHDYFKHWGLDKCVPTWASRGVADTIDARAAMIFCGWWNDAYGDAFGERRPDAEGAYHGPATLPSMGRVPIVVNSTPHELSACLRDYVPASGHFNHKNAWSRSELAELVQKHGFSVISTDAQAIQDRLAYIPTLSNLVNISMYMVAQ